MQSVARKNGLPLVSALHSLAFSKNFPDSSADIKQSRLEMKDAKLIIYLPHTIYRIPFVCWWMNHRKLKS